MGIMIGINLIENKNIERVYIVLAIAVALLFVFFAYTSFSATLSTEEIEAYLQEARDNAFGGDVYNIDLSISNYEKVLESDPDNGEVLYSLSRALYVTQKFDKAAKTIEIYKKLYPQNKRAYYLSGLIYMSAGNLDKSEAEFAQFIGGSDFAGWQGYLDLAAVYFEGGKYELAKESLESAISKFGENAWINTSLGATLIALGDEKTAVQVLDRAEKQVGEITPELWRENYLFNDPAKISDGIETIKAAIAFNKSIINGEIDVSSAQKSIIAGFTFLSPNGAMGGVVVSACGETDSCSTIPCVSGANACGQSGSGTYTSCTLSGNTSCNASSPPLPSGYGTTCQLTNSCGNTSSGTLGCDGSCSAAPVGSCSTFAPSISASACVTGQLYVLNISAIDPEGDRVRFGIDWNNDGTVDQFAPTGSFASSGEVISVGNTFPSDGIKIIRIRTEDETGEISPFISHTFSCSLSNTALLGGNNENTGAGSGIPEGEITARPLLVRAGETTTVIWNAGGVDSCTVTGNNGDSFDGTNGIRTSGSILSKTTFVLNCDNGTVTDSVAVDIVPVFQEI
jgi:tetratricopeptide (TPR) repeat protein